MKTTFDFVKIRILEASSEEINSELFKRKMQLKTHRSSLDVANLEIYIEELKTRRSELKLLKALQNDKEFPFNKTLLIISVLLLVIFGMGSIYSGSYLLAVVALIDFVIAVIALINFIDLKREEGNQ